ncbi:MAG: L,D-transpeptidase family protein [Hyphomicrobiales bacterium]|nr:L,D-transpeptidase family protein [Hyphomicrobiales bacterium]MCP5370481.1 L,D-transpeptidase family protein [Hyphomicrobiales bacterium]
MRIRVDPAGRLTWNGAAVRCALGRGGVTADKREGDGATPIGAFPLRRVFHRPDRVPAPPTGLPVRALTPADGWCDDPASPDYNTLIQKPFSARHEDMWRDDGLYDLVVELGYNDDPPVPGRGSAIFLHVAGPGLASTEGCVAMALPDLLGLLRRCGPGAVLEVTPPAG